VPEIGFFHPVNALLIFAIAGSIVFTTWREARGGVPPEPSPSPTAT